MIRWIAFTTPWMLRGIALITLATVTNGCPHVTDLAKRFDNDKEDVRPGSGDPR